MISILASTMRFTIRGLLFIGFLLVILTPILVLVNHNRRLGTQEGSRKADQGAVRLAKSLVWFFGLKVQVTGEPQAGPVLIAANHISWLDIPVLHSGHAMGFVGKAEIDSWPVFRSIARVGGTI